MSFQEGDHIVRHDCHYPEEALVVDGSNEQGQWLAHPLGGGFQFVIPSSDIGQFKRVPEEEQTPIFRKSHFAIEGLKTSFAGWTDGRLWNGWAMPRFEFDEAQRLIAALDLPGNYDAERDTITTQGADQEFEVWPAELIHLPDGRELIVYPIGAGSWIWEEQESEASP